MLHQPYKTQRRAFLNSNRVFNNHTLSQAIDSYIIWRQPKGNDLAYLHRLQHLLGAKSILDIGQAEIDEAARTLYPKNRRSSWNRQVYVPMSAVLHYVGVPVPFRKPPNDLRKRRPVSRQYAEEFLSDVRDQDLKALLTLLFFSGARLGEAATLKPSSVDLVRRRILFRLGKRSVYSWRHLHDRAWSELCKLPFRTNRVFRWRTIAGAHQALERHCSKHGVKFTFHQTRHSFATWLADGGAGMKEIMEAGGWTSVRSAIIYVEPSEKRMRRAILGL